MVSRKRTRSEADAPAEQPEQPHDEQPGLLTQLRNCWEFANLMQYIAIFGKIMKIDEDFGIEVRGLYLYLYLYLYTRLDLRRARISFRFLAGRTQTD